jgi:Protein of unknown function (DUF3892)
MAEREVTATRKSGDYVTELCNPAEDWSPVPAADAIVQTQVGMHHYFAQWPRGRIQIMDVSDEGGRYLRADADYTSRNNLLDLPDPS